MVALSSSVSAPVYLKPGTSLKKTSCEARTQIYFHMWKALIILRLRKKRQKFFINNLTVFPFQ